MGALRCILQYLYIIFIKMYLSCSFCVCADLYIYMHNLCIYTTVYGDETTFIYTFVIAVVYSNNNGIYCIIYLCITIFEK